jgi:hypothetical protein
MTPDDRTRFDALQARARALRWQIALVNGDRGALAGMRRYHLLRMDGPADIHQDKPMHDGLDELEAAIVEMETQQRAPASSSDVRARSARII